MKLILLALLSLLPLSAPASTPADFDAAKWQPLLDKVAFLGTPASVDGIEYRTYANVVPNDVSQPRQADYFSVVGGLNSLGKFQPMEVSAVSETWTKDQAGNWQIEQWLWTVALDGNLKEVGHTRLVEDSSSTVLSVVNLATGAPDTAEELGRWGEKLQFWLDYKLH